MSGVRSGRTALIGGLAAGLVLLLAVGLIGFGLAGMTATSEPTPFRSACQGDDACRAALVERLPKLQATPGGVATAMHEALNRSAPVLPPDATLAACQATGAPESCALDPAKLKPGEAAALVAALDAYGLMLSRQDKACRHVEGCAVRALAALGEYGFDPVRVQGALQRTSLPLPPELKACAAAPPEAVREVCAAERLLKAPQDSLVVALEQDWASGGVQARLPHPADPQTETAKTALWAGLGAVVGLVIMGMIWLGAALVRRDPGNNRLTAGAQGGPVAAGAAPMPAQARPVVTDLPPAPPGPFPGRERLPARAADPSPRRDPPSAATAPPPPGAAARGAQGRSAAPPPRRPAPPAATDSPEAAPVLPAVSAFQTALAIPGPAATFARLATEEGARLSPRFDDGERLAAGAILAAHRLRGDRPAEAHAGAYDDLVLAAAGRHHRLVWPRPGAPITAEMDTCEEGDLYSHTVEAVVRPGLVDGAGALLLRARVRAR